MLVKGATDSVYLFDIILFYTNVLICLQWQNNGIHHLDMLYKLRQVYAYINDTKRNWHWF